MREIIFDTETTGLSPQNGDRMVEMGCVEMVNRVATGAVYHAYYNPERDMPSEAERIHGLSSAFLSDKPLFRDSAQEFLDFVGDAPMVAHNASFDFGFMNAELEAAGLEPIDRERMVDTVAIARRKHPGAKNSLDALCTRYGVDRSHRVKHGALLDAELLSQVYVELLGGRQIGLELAADTPDTRDAMDSGSSRGNGHNHSGAAAGHQPLSRGGQNASETRGGGHGSGQDGSAHNAGAQGQEANNSGSEQSGETADWGAAIHREARPHEASADELARHGAFIEKIPKAVWNK